MTTIGRCWMAALGLMMTTAACGSSDTPGAGTKAALIDRAPTPKNEFTPVEIETTLDNLIAKVNEGTVEPMQMVVLLKNLNTYFAPIATGANRAMGELEVTGNVLGPTDQSTDPTTSQDIQNQQIQQAVADGAEGIGISPYGDFNGAAMDDAVAKGVHVVTFDGDVPTSKRSFYVGTLNKSAGATAGKTLLAMLPPPPGTVLIHGTFGAVWMDGYNRTQGAREVIEAAGYVPLVSEAVYHADEAFDVDSMKSRIEAADPPVIGMVGLFDISYRCVMGADAAGIPDVPIVAFDFNPKTVEYMRQGRIKATHTQRQYYQGYLVPYILYGIRTIGLDGTKEILAPLMDGGSTVNTGISTVPSDKIDAYNDFLDMIGATQ
ncbi:sugar ABC transporter [Sorangium cellulosum]|uniref:Sugar ABC transporter n=1 Tax=Sorangium cellulosum TaxID=56 RepID=A0A2L0ET20_SORCE|nr:substrate-binding domain-containing protein [Sorangium cellulosum]AUX42424.1 sugar ABC transporter [Sorangium cellulosum]